MTLLLFVGALCGFGAGLGAAWGFGVGFGCGLAGFGAVFWLELATAGAAAAIAAGEFGDESSTDPVGSAGATPRYVFHIFCIGRGQGRFWSQAGKQYSIAAAAMRSVRTVIRATCPGVKVVMHASFE